MKILEILTPKRKIGSKGEKIAAKHLKRKGYKIKRRNYAPFDNEIDIIAENKDTLAFVEVKTRTVGKDFGIESRPAAAVTPEKQRKIISAAKYYIGGRENTKKVSLDIIEVYLDDSGHQTEVVHIENAFNSDTAYKERYIKR